MGRLSKEQTRQHDAAVDLLKLGAAMTQDQREQVYQNWSPMAEHNVGKNAVFFTPVGLAHDLAMWVPERGRILDLCAGIGVLSWATLCSAGAAYHPEESKLEITAVELNQEFVKVGKQLLPNVNWVTGNIFDKSLLAQLGTFDCVISNPPFGNIVTKQVGNWLSYKGPAHLMAVEVALRLAPRAVMILPQTDLPFKCSGQTSHEHIKPEQWSTNFSRIHTLLPDVQWSWESVDTSAYEWQGTSPTVELVGIENDSFETPYPAGLEAKLPLPEPHDSSETPEPAPQPQPTLPTPALALDIDPNQMTLF